ncbi:melanoma-derived growth regulatory protein isoform X2 [Pteropus medius]|uniref:melanoma-derived growth regulatory protein isoform X2 n=1 Tax=Pteropus vampyrus TaxID=132908 RepID=UPI00196A7A6B|nr:melanoma-derived growth regulatory protein isoform X2 [Pteropus giganteus]
MQTFLLVGAEGLEGERGLPASRKDNYHRWQMKTSRLPHWQSQVLWSADPGCSVGGRPMPKLAERKLCADEECSYPISMAVALQDYVAPDCRFLTIHRGQVVYVFSKLKGRGRLFWGGSVSFEKRNGFREITMETWLLAWATSPVALYVRTRL